MPRPMVPAPRTATVAMVSMPVGSSMRSGNRDAVHAGRLGGEVARLVGDRQGVAGGGRGELLELGGDGVLLEDLAAEPVVMGFLRLDHFLVEVGGPLVADRTAEGHEL